MARRITLLSIGIVLAFSLGCEIDQTREGRMPEVEVREGQLPRYDVRGPDVDVRMKPETVRVPEVDVQTREETIEVPDIDVRFPGSHDEPNDIHD